MTNGRAVRKDFLRKAHAGSLAGSNLKLLLRKVGNRYFAGLTHDELYERYDAGENRAQHLSIYAKPYGSRASS